MLAGLCGARLVPHSDVSANHDQVRSQVTLRSWCDLRQESEKVMLLK